MVVYSPCLPLDCLLFWFKHNFTEHTAVNFTSKTLAGQSKKLKLVSSIAQLQFGWQSVCSFVFCLFVVLFSLCVCVFIPFYLFVCCC